MKKQLNKKLTLNKENISKLNPDDMVGAKGGMTLFACTLTANCSIDLGCSFSCTLLRVCCN